MKTKIYLIFGCFIFCFITPITGNGQLKPHYSYSLALDQLKNDRLKVELQYSGNMKDSLIFCMPKMVPGIYSQIDFGRFISSIRAFDNTGNGLSLVQLDSNRWWIPKKNDFQKLVYWVEDGWEQFDFEDLRPYRSAESSFSEQVWVLSAPQLFGYFKNDEEGQFGIEVQKPKGYYGATSLGAKFRGATTDRFEAKDYKTLVDSPILYAQPDTAHVRLPGIQVEVAAYRTDNKKMAKAVAAHIQPLLKGQSDYLGGTLPVDRYSFLLYHNLNPKQGSYFSEGLEHGASTLVLMYIPDDMDLVKETIYHTASHEFFHNLLPIALHSEEIEQFDFNGPEFSEHLWLYEGTTEYFTIHMPVKQRLHGVSVLVKELNKKYQHMIQNEKGIGLLDLSRDPVRHQDHYMQVYNKAALFNLCLDIELLELSNGSYGLRHLIQDLVAKYGPGKPFKDAHLFDEMVEVSGYTGLKPFFKRYLENNEALPLEHQLMKIGMGWQNETEGFTLMASPTPKQDFLRKAWLGDYLK